MKFEIKANVENGILKTNAEELKNAVIPELKKYEYVVDESTYDTAKKDRASLNKLTKQVSEERKRIEEDVFAQWKTDKKTLMEIEKAIKSRADELGSGIKEIDDVEKKKKYEALKKWWDEHKNYEVEYHLVHEDGYLNKKATGKKVQESLIEKLEKINRDMNVMQTFLPNDEFEAEQIINVYLNTLDMSKAKDKANELKELHKKVDQMVKKPKQGQINFHNKDVEYGKENIQVEDTKSGDVYWAKFEIKGSKEAFLKLPSVLKELGISYKVLEKGRK